MTKYTTVLASLLRHLSRSDFEKAVKSRQADKGVRAHMRLLRDKQPIKRREPFPFRIGTKNRNLMYIF